MNAGGFEGRNPSAELALGLRLRFGEMVRVDEHHRRLLADHLLGRPAEQPLGAPVEDLDRAARIGRDDADFDRRVEDRRKLAIEGLAPVLRRLQRRLGRLSPADVADHRGTVMLAFEGHRVEVNFHRIHVSAARTVSGFDDERTRLLQLLPAEFPSLRVERRIDVEGVHLRELLEGIAELPTGRFVRIEQPRIGVGPEHRVAGSLHRHFHESTKAFGFLPGRHVTDDDHDLADGGVIVRRYGTDDRLDGDPPPIRRLDQPFDAVRAAVPQQGVVGVGGSPRLQGIDEELQRLPTDDVRRVVPEQRLRRGRCIGDASLQVGAKHDVAGPLRRVAERLTDLVIAGGELLLQRDQVAFRLSPKLAFLRQRLFEFFAAVHAVRLKSRAGLSRDRIADRPCRTTAISVLLAHDRHHDGPPPGLDVALQVKHLLPRAEHRLAAGDGHGQRRAERRRLQV